MWFGLLVLILVLLALLTTLFVIVEEREEAILERLGKFQRILKSGFRLKLPAPFEVVAYRHETREQVLDVPAQECITKNNVQVMVDGLIYLQVMDIYKASYNVDDYRSAAIAMAQSTMRSEIGKLDLDSTFSKRTSMNDNIVAEIDEASEPWGVKVLRYEVKNITPSQETVTNMEQKMESERQRREDNIDAEGQSESVRLESEGHKQADINHSEGIKQKTINESEGRAQEIQLLANATAQGLQRMAEAIDRPGGALAVRTRLMEQSIDELQKVLDTARVSVLPADLANLKGVVETAVNGQGHSAGNRTQPASQQNNG